MKDSEPKRGQLSDWSPTSGTEVGASGAAYHFRTLRLPQRTFIPSGEEGLDTTLSQLAPSAGCSSTVSTTSSPSAAAGPATTRWRRTGVLALGAVAALFLATSECYVAGPDDPVEPERSGPP